jgi:hypothetical protein
MEVTYKSRINDIDCDLAPIKSKLLTLTSILPLGFLFAVVLLKSIDPFKIPEEHEGNLNK